MPQPALSPLRRLIQALGHVRRFVLNPRIRSEQITRMRAGAAHYQGATHTSRDRYPELFAACAFEFAGRAQPRILSFGSSTGEEAATLADYLPQAIIVGVDINPWCLQQASTSYPQHRFIPPAELTAEAPFDAIFAMAVFQRTENRTQAPEVALGTFTFAVFDQELARLDALLKPNGLLFIDEADFLFLDATISERYTALPFPDNQVAHQRPLFGRDNRRIASEYLTPRAFRKLA